MTACEFSDKENIDVCILLSGDNKLQNIVDESARARKPKRETLWSLRIKYGGFPESGGVHHATKDSETKIQRHDESCIATPLYNGRRIQVLSLLRIELH